MNTDYDTTADIIGERLDSDAVITVSGRGIAVAFDDDHSAYVTLNGNTATVRLIRGFRILIEMRVAFYDSEVSGHLVARAVESYRDMVSAGVLP